MPIKNRKKGGKYPATAALYMINWLTKKYCLFESHDLQSMDSTVTRNETIRVTKPTILSHNTCSTTYQTKVKLNTFYI